MPTAGDGKESCAGEGALSIDGWMEQFYASLLDHDPAKLAQRLEVVRLRGRNRRLHRAASHSERQMLRAALRAIEELERWPRENRSNDVSPPKRRRKAA